jgi:hypothetical protein
MNRLRAWLSAAAVIVVFFVFGLGVVLIGCDSNSSEPQRQQETLEWTALGQTPRGLAIWRATDSRGNTIYTTWDRVFILPGKSERYSASPIPFERNK